MSPSLLRRAGQRAAFDVLGSGVVLLNLVALLSVCLVLATRDVAAERAVSLQDEYVVVVTGAASSDGLVAESLGDAVLAVPDGGDTRSLTEHVDVLNPTSVVVLGGLDSVSARAAAALVRSTLAPVTRLAGADRYATAAQAAVATFEAPVQQVLIATPDASPHAARAAGQQARGTPVLLVTRDGVPAATAQALQRLRPVTVTVVGGTGVVSEAVLEQLERYAPGRVTRLLAT